MVEQITAETLRLHLSNLLEGDLLEPELALEMENLVEEMDGFSNWLDARKFLLDSHAQKLSGSGPISKFLRTLAFTLEQVDENSAALKERGARLSRISLSDTTSGCSDFQGALQVIGTDSDGNEVLLQDGRFVWDCAEHGMSQPEAAQKLGYRCMVRFPEFEPRVESAR